MKWLDSIATIVVIVATGVAIIAILTCNPRNLVKETRPHLTTPTMNIPWEEVENAGLYSIYRAAMPGGWLLITKCSGPNGLMNSLSTTFIPDEHHNLWILKKK
jgi:hypothetical protein